MEDEKKIENISMEEKTASGNNKPHIINTTTRRILLCAGICVIVIVAIAIMLASLLSGNKSSEENSNSGNKNTGSDLTSDEDIIYTLNENAIKFDEENGINYVNNMVIIFFNENTDSKEIARIVSSIDGKIVGQLPFIDQYQVEIPERSLSGLQSVCDQLTKESSVMYASCDILIENSEVSAGLPKDNWGEKVTWNEENPDGNNWWLEAIEAPSAWQYNDRLEKIKIGILDSGFDSNHEDLKGVITYTCLLNDSRLHGTHVAGIIGAIPNNNKGISGVVHNCEIVTYDHSASLFDKDLLISSRVFSGLSILVKKGAKVVNCSFGANNRAEISDINKPFTSFFLDQIVHESAMYMSKLIKKGYDFIIVQAAGNDSVDATKAGFFAGINNKHKLASGITLKQVTDRIIVVGAAQNDGNNSYSKSVFKYGYTSNSGSRVDIWAPGSEIYSTVVGNKYDYASGTSMAAPVVTGVVAMVWTANPKLTGAEVKEIVCDVENTNRMVYDYDTGKYYPMVNAYLAVSAAIEKKNNCPHNDTSVIYGYDATAYSPGLTNGLKCNDCGKVLEIQEEIPPIAQESKPESSGLEFTLNTDGRSYSLTGLGMCDDSDIVIPSKYNDLPVTKIGDNAFSFNFFNIKINSIVIPNGVEVIGEKAFIGCDLMTSITIPSSVKSINYSGLYACSSLETIYYDNTIANWEAIGKAEEWDTKTNYYYVRCIDGIIPKKITNLSDLPIVGTHNSAINNLNDKDDYYFPKAVDPYGNIYETSYFDLCSYQDGSRKVEAYTDLQADGKFMYLEGTIFCRQRQNALYRISFKIYADGVLVYDSGLMSKDSEPKYFKVCINNAQVIRIQSSSSDYSLMHTNPGIILVNAKCFNEE